LVEIRNKAAPVGRINN
jgi:hypothetical protein